MKMRIKYGNEKSQYGELYVPETNCIGIVCLLHGGFWTMPYDLHQFDNVAVELLNLGYCIWNIEYRRIGEINHKWSDVFDDVINAVNELINIKNIYNHININNVFIVGHSAGGHLAIWLNSQDLKIDVKKFIGLSPILDLEIAYYENSGNGSVGKLLHGNPNEFPERYLYSSPINMHRKNCSEFIIHGKMDDVVPIKWSKFYHEKVRQLTVISHLIELEACGHMDFIDPKSNAFDVLKSILRINKKNNFA